MLLDDYTAALFPEPYRVLGRELLPLTIGHGLLLARMGSPFAPWTPAQDTIGAGDVLTAVSICSRPQAKALDWVTRRSFGFMARLWKWRACHWPGAEARLHHAAGLLGRYVRESCQGPKVWLKAEAARCKVPTLIVLKTALQEWLGATHETAMATPVAVALIELTVYSERHGAIDLVSPEEAEAIDRLRAGQTTEGFSA